MKKRLLLNTALLLILTIACNAAPVSLETAKKVALNYFSYHSTRAASSSKVSIIKDGNEALIYLFTFEPAGFVMVAADDAIIPVLGYSTDNTFDVEHLPANAAWWFNSYKSQIKSIVNSRIDNSATKLEWEQIQKKQMVQSRGSVAPLLSTTWDQGQYYNTSCPADVAAVNSDGHVYTGCVATAMAQIMRYYSYPTTGSGSHSYTHPTYGSLSADYSATTYNWAGMPYDVSTSNDEVAKLMFHCGVAVDMNYGVAGSGAHSSDVPNALKTYFSYSPTAELKHMSDFSAAGWSGLLKAELDASRVIYYSGDDGEAGHAFVCDGYDATNKFHFNWGWSGAYNGYFAIGSLNPGGSSFNQGNDAIVRIRPTSNAPIANFTASTVFPEVGGAISFTDKSTNNPTSWLWTFEGGSPSTSTDQNPQNITYATAGSYVVTLTVSNASGSDIKTMPKFILVGGSTDAWIRQNTGFSAASRGIDQIKIVSPNVVWAKAYDGTTPANYIREFTRTTDGGITWTPGTISFTGSENFGVSNIFPLSDLVCYACMFPISGTGGKIVKTIDGGLTWIEQSSATFTDSWANFVHFFNENDGVAMGDPVAGEFFIITTADGGATWIQVAVDKIPNCTTNEAGVSNMYTAVDNTIWFSSSNGRVYKSIDKGANWTVATTGLTKVLSLSFKDATTGFASLGASPYTLKKTVDGGSTWSTVIPTGFYTKAPQLAFLKGTDAIWIDASVGPGHGSSFSINDCASFNNIDTGKVQYTELAFLDKETGWAGSFNASATEGGIYKWNYNWLITTDVAPIVATEEKMRIYPNPSNGQLFVDLVNSNKKPSSIVVYSMVGSKVREIKPSEEVGPFSINLTGLKTGIYILSIMQDGKVISTQRVSIME